MVFWFQFNVGNNAAAQSSSDGEQKDPLRSVLQRQNSEFVI